MPYVEFYNKQIAYYNHTAYEILTNEIGLISPTFPEENIHKRGIISSVVSGFIGLAYEEIIYSFLHHKRQKAFIKQCLLWKRRQICSAIEFFSFGGLYDHVWKLNHWSDWYLSKDGVGHLQ